MILILLFCLLSLKAGVGNFGKASNIKLALKE